MFHRKRTRLSGNTLPAYVEESLAGPRSSTVFEAPHPPVTEKLHLREHRHLFSLPAMHLSHEWRALVCRPRSLQSPEFPPTWLREENSVTLRCVTVTQTNLRW